MAPNTGMYSNYRTSIRNRLRLAGFHLLVATAMLIATGCFDDDPIETPLLNPQLTVAMLSNHAIEEHEDMLAIAKEVPEFGGYYFDDFGGLSLP